LSGKIKILFQSSFNSQLRQFRIVAIFLVENIVGIS